MAVTNFGSTKELAIAKEVLSTSAGLSIANIGGIVATLPQNTDFTVKFDPGVFTGLLIRPTKTVIVSQDPPAGDFVPSGTPINVTVIEKGLIPPKSFNGLNQAVVDKFPSIAALEDDLAKPNDPVAAAAKTVLDKGVPFAQLADADKTAVTNYVNNRLGTTPDPAKAAGDISFLYQL